MFNTLLLLLMLMLLVARIVRSRLEGSLEHVVVLDGRRPPGPHECVARRRVNSSHVLVWCISLFMLCAVCVNDFIIVYSVILCTPPQEVVCVSSPQDHAAAGGPQARWTRRRA